MTTAMNRLLGKVRRRMTLRAAVEECQVGAAAGALVAFAVLGLARLGVEEIDPLWALPSGVAVALGWVAVRLVLRRPAARRVAAVADERLGLAERLSTALWVESAAPAEAAVLGALVAQDAAQAAAAVSRQTISRAFRPQLRPRPLAVFGAGVALCAGLLLWQPVAEAVETESQRAARLADENRIADVARRLREAAKRVEEAARERKEETLERTAAEVKKRTDEMVRKPPPRETALKRLNELSDLAREAARKTAGMREAADAQEATQEDRELQELLRDLAAAGLDSLQRDLAELEKRLKESAAGGSEAPPSPEEIRALANRIDALRRAMERAAAEGGAERLAERLRTLGNEDVLAKIAQRLRELAARAGQGGEGYEGLQGEAGEDLDLSTMSREELEQLLRDLDELAGMEDLAEAMRQGGGEIRGGRKLRLGGAGGT